MTDAHVVVIDLASPIRAGAASPAGQRRSAHPAFDQACSGGLELLPSGSPLFDLDESDSGREPAIAVMPSTSA
jgi:hypothetical protein